MLVIIADDLTGTLDTAAPFAARGLQTRVVLTVDAIADGLALSPDVMSINIASREKPEAFGFQAMRRVIEQLPPGIRLFKKIDSRLKGHIASELDAISYRRALVTPAIPSFGRVVRNGQIDGFGVAAPIRIADVLGTHSERSIIPDIAKHEDLLAALQSCEADGVDLLVGARGLAEALAYRMTGRTKSELVAPPVGQGLFVIGSHDRITIEQVEQLRPLDMVDYKPAPNGVVPVSPVKTSPVVLVQATEGAAKISSEEVARNLADSVHPSLTSMVRTMLLCGGATAEAVLAKMGVTGFRLEGECLPGLGLAYAGGQCIILKSGGFGEPETLARLATQLFDRRS